MPHKVLDLVKTAIFYEFLKLNFFYPRTSEAETGNSVVKQLVFAIHAIDNLLKFSVRS